MTLEETKKLLITINALYPNWNVENPEATTQAWHWTLEEYPAEAVNAALQVYVKTNKTGFAPSVSQLINSMYEPSVQDRLSEGDAWALVKKAISDGGYHAEERYNELPELVQRAIGSPSMIHQWAMTDSSEVNTVVMSNFQRNYRTVCQRQEFTDKVNPQISDLLREMDRKQIGVSDEKGNY